MNDKMQSSVDNPLAFFKSLVNYGGIKEHLQQFINDSEIIGAYYNESELSLSYRETNNKGEQIEIKELFPLKLSRKIKEEASKTIILIDERLMSDLEAEVDIRVVKNILNDLYSLHQKSEKIRNTQIKHSIQVSLRMIIQHIQSNYSYLDIWHRAYNLFRKQRDFRHSFFGAVRENREFYYKLHDLFYDNEIIPENAEDSEEFVTVLTSTYPNQTGLAISFFRVKKFEIALILRSLEPFFKNFTFKPIHESGCFYNKMGEMIIERHLSSALSDYYKKERRLSPRVQAVLDEIEQCKSIYTTFK